MADGTGTILGKDIKVDFEEGDILFNNSNDFLKIVGQNNFVQAVKLRLLTPLGQMAIQPTYGSRLPELKGAPKTDATRSLAILYAYEALLMDARVREIVSLAADFVINNEGEDMLEVNVRLKEIQSNNILNFVIQVG